MFKFKLEKLLTIRKKQEEEIGRLYALKLKEIENTRKKINSLSIEEERIKNEMKNRVKFIGELQQINNYLLKLNKDKNKLLTEIKTLKKEAENIKRRLLEARKKRKILETLKEKQFQKYLYEQKLLEQKIIDEVGTGKFIRKKS